MLEWIFGAGGADLIRDEYRILFTGWSESEQRFLLLLFVVVIVPAIKTIRDRLGDD